MLANFVRESANAPGTATTINLGGAAAGRMTFVGAFGNGGVCFYFLDDGTQAESGIGTVTSGSPNTLTRTTVLWNTAGTTARLNFTGAVRVYSSLPAERTVRGDANGNVGIGLGTATAESRQHVRGVNIGNSVNDASNVLSLEARAAGANYDRLRFVAVRTVSGSDWTGVDFVLQRVVDSTDVGQIRFIAGGGIAMETGGLRRSLLNNDGALYLGATGGGTGFTGVLHGRGMNTRTGELGSFGGHVFNCHWTGTGADVWITNTNVGTIQLTSDRRVKKDIEPLGSVLAAFMRLKPVSYRFANIGIYADDGLTRWGFISDDVEDVFPVAVMGERDAVDTAGNIKPQSIVDRPLITILTKALQEAVERLEAAEARISALEAA